VGEEGREGRRECCKDEEEDTEEGEGNEKVRYTPRSAVAAQTFFIYQSSLPPSLQPPDVRMQGNFVVTVETLVRHYCPLDAPPSLALKYIHQLDYATSGVLCLGLSRK
jgi:hypothetical protein